MFKKILTAFLLTLALPVSAQTSLSSVLDNIESNSVELKARRETAKAAMYEIRMDNSLGDLSVSYSHLWGRPGSLGTSGEFEISQAFDFPTVYAARGRMAGSVRQQLEADYMVLRQQILQEAKELYIELYGLTEQVRITRLRLDMYKRNKELHALQHKTGNVTVLEKITAEKEYILAADMLASYLARITEIKSGLRILNGGMEMDLSTLSIPAEDIIPYNEALAFYRENDPSMTVYKLSETTSAHGVKLSKAQSLPKFEIGYKNEFAARERFNGITAGISIPIHSNRHNVSRAKAAQASAMLESHAAAIRLESRLLELYEKAALYKTSLDRYDGFPEAEDYIAILNHALATGEINIVKYYSEADSFYEAMESKIQAETEYRLLVARINMAYL